MTSHASRSNHFVAGVAASATQIVVTAAVLAGKDYKRRSRRCRRNKQLSPFHDDSSVKKLIAVDEGGELVDFGFGKKSNHGVTVVRSRSPSPILSRRVRRETSPPMSEIVLQPETSHKKSSLSEAELLEVIKRVKARRAAEKEGRFVEDMSSSQTVSTGTSLASATPEHVHFYTPKLGVSSKADTVIDSSLDDPTALRHILRPWQAEFLESLGILTASQFLKAKKKRKLYNDMRQWRKRQNLLTVQKDSCKVALHIWAHTCKVVIKAVKKQRAEGRTLVEKPKILQSDIIYSSIGSTGTVTTVGTSASSLSLPAN